MLLPKDLLKDCEKVEDPNKYATEKALHPDRPLTRGLSIEELESIRESLRGNALRGLGGNPFAEQGFGDQQQLLQQQLQTRANTVAFGQDYLYRAFR